MPRLIIQKYYCLMIVILQLDFKQQQKSCHMVSSANFSVNILSRLLQNRLLHTINTDQVVFVKGRKVTSNLSRSCRMYVKYSKLIVSLSTEKAFDCVEWTFCFHNTRKCGLETKCFIHSVWFYKSHSLLM